MAESSNRHHKIPASLIQVKKRFTNWRQTHPKRTRLPEELWLAAVTVAREFGHNKTAKALGLDYYSLKKRLRPTSPPAHKQNHPQAETSFIELISPASPECMIEIDDFKNKRMRISLKNITISDLASLAQCLWEKGVCSK